MKSKNLWARCAKITTKEKSAVHWSEHLPSFSSPSRKIWLSRERQVRRSSPCCQLCPRCGLGAHAPSLSLAFSICYRTESVAPLIWHRKQQKKISCSHLWSTTSVKRATLSFHCLNCNRPLCFYYYFYFPVALVLQSHALFQSISTGMRGSELLEAATSTLEQSPGSCLCTGATTSLPASLRVWEAMQLRLRGSGPRPLLLLPAAVFVSPCTNHLTTPWADSLSNNTCSHAQLWNL